MYEKEGTVVYEAPPREKTYPVASVVAFVLAVCLAHFLLVVGSFTGERGYTKLQAAVHWVSDYVLSV